MTMTTTLTHTVLPRPLGPSTHPSEHERDLGANWRAADTVDFGDEHHARPETLCVGEAR